MEVKMDRTGRCTSCGAEMRHMDDNELLEYFFDESAENLSEEERREELREIEDNCNVWVCIGCGGTYYLD